MTIPRLPTIAWIGLAAGAAMVIGSFGPWAKAVGFINLSISGTDSSNDGWFVVVAAAVGAGGLLLYSRGWNRAATGRLSSFLVSHGRRVGALVALAGGVVGAIITIEDRGDVTNAESENTSELVTLQVGWGLNLAMGASIVLGIVGLVALLGNRHAPGMTVFSQPESNTVQTGPLQPEPPTALSRSTAAEVERLNELHARGVLTDDEFSAAKERLLEG